MLSDLIKRFYRFFGLFILITLCSSVADLTRAEASIDKIDIPAESKFSCAIAKSAYGSPGFDAPIRRLRAFRDRVLRGSDLGRRVVWAYYRFSGSLEPYLEGGALSGPALRWSIRAFLFLVMHLEAIGLGAGVVLMLFLLGRGQKGPPRLQLSEVTKLGPLVRI